MDVCSFARPRPPPYEIHAIPLRIQSLPESSAVDCYYVFPGAHTYKYIICIKIAK